MNRENFRGWWKLVAFALFATYAAHAQVQKIVNAYGTMPAVLANPAICTTPNNVFTVEGLTNVNDGYGGMFYYDMNSAATVNPTNVFALTSCAGRVIRLFGGVPSQGGGSGANTIWTNTGSYITSLPFASNLFRLSDASLLMAMDTNLNSIVQWSGDGASLNLLYNATNVVQYVATVGDFTYTLVINEGGTALISLDTLAGSRRLKLSPTSLDGSIPYVFLSDAQHTTGPIFQTHNLDGKGLDVFFDGSIATGNTNRWILKGLTVNGGTTNAHWNINGTNFLSAMTPE